MTLTLTAVIETDAAATVGPNCEVSVYQLEGLAQPRLVVGPIETDVPTEQHQPPYWSCGPDMKDLTTVANRVLSKLGYRTSTPWIADDSTWRAKVERWDTQP